MPCGGLAGCRFARATCPGQLPLLEQALSIYQEVDIPIWFSWMAAALGAAHTLSGRSAEAIPRLTQAMAQVEVQS